MGVVQGKPDERGVPRSDLCCEGSVLSAGDRGTNDLRQVDQTLGTRFGALRAGYAGDDVEVLGLDASQGT